QVLATGGDAALGGDDIDQLVAERFFSERNAVGGSAPDGRQIKLALVTARLAKEYLSTQTEWSGLLDLANRSTTHKLDRSTLESLALPLIDRTVAICRGVLEDADVAPAAVLGVVLVGGATRMPL